MQTLGRVRKIIEKAGSRGTFFQKFRAKMRQFLAKKIKKIIRNITFEKINTLSLFGRLKFARSKGVLKKLYAAHLQRLQEEVKHRKIRVGFLVNSKCKWHGQFLCDMLAKSDNFEPIIFAAKKFYSPDVCELHELAASFQNAGLHVEYACDVAAKKYLDLEIFKPDIVFYEQPWNIEKEHGIFRVAKFALTCYTPYCFHLLQSEYDYLEKFHRFLWKYFVESPMHLESYKSRFNADNCVSVGSLHLDGYSSDEKPNENLWKDKSGKKKRIIYAPHFSTAANHMMATFQQNGQFILNLAGMYPETTWIIRPHPHFDEEVVNCGVVTKQELADYWDEWEKYGTISRQENFIDLFRTSDCLITDCISFLADYFPTGKPVFHLRSDMQTREFNNFAEDIIKTYYQIRSNAQLDQMFLRVIIEGDDYMAPQRLSQIKAMELVGNKTASERVFNHIKSELKIQ
ncbi:MAG: CDP-glycerol glycerophosphotransferase family protein [Puniceicoccales bacterium]|jgi:hypothetical protein|nr:CDP-glycerol glycerophosphotransferase family protein [Puniceicoccales bacterium]